MDAMRDAACNVGVPPPEMLKSLSGIEYLQRIVDGRLPRPPITETLGFAIYNPIGTFTAGSPPLCA